MKTVLHITEAFGGGVQTAINSYVNATEHYPIQHLLLARRRPQDDTGLASSPLFQETTIIDGNLWHFYQQAKKIITQNRPDIIHLHSSIAGFIGRFLPVGNAKIIYTPHCYSFERRDISSIMQQLYIRLERLGLSRIDVVAGCSQRECDLAQHIGAKQTRYLNNYANIIEVNNQHRVETCQLKNATQADQVVNVVVVGRVCAQKDPDFLIATSRHLTPYPEFTQIKLHWIGGGDIEQVNALRNAGINVTGMLTYQEVMQTLQAANLYLHTAAWEGMPLTVLEAAKLNVPIILRRIGATQHFHYPFLVSSPEEMAKQIITFIRRPTNPDYQAALDFFKHEFSVNKQQQSLLELYECNLPSPDKANQSQPTNESKTQRIKATDRGV